jgi:hypothetical protein
MLSCHASRSLTSWSPISCLELMRQLGSWTWRGLGQSYLRLAQTTLLARQMIWCRV